MRYGMIKAGTMIEAPDSMRVGNTDYQPTSDYFKAMGFKPIVPSPMTKDPFKLYEGFGYGEDDEYIYEIPLDNGFKPLEECISIKLNQLMDHDTSDEVNVFSYKGIDMILPLEKRIDVMRGLMAEKALGIEQTYLAYEPTGDIFEVTIDEAIEVINRKEVNAKEIWEVTFEHSLAIKALATPQEVVDYDFTIGYPEKLILI